MRVGPALLVRRGASPVELRRSVVQTFDSLGVPPYGLDNGHLVPGTRGCPPRHGIARPVQ